MDRPCTCHPDDNPPKPCQHQYALSECRVSALVHAAAQVLDDMGVNGLSTCEATKAQLRVAFEPFRDETEHGVMDYPLDWAEQVVAQIGK